MPFPPILIAAAGFVAVKGIIWVGGRFVQHGLDPKATAEVLQKDAQTFGVDMYTATTTIATAQDITSLIKGIHAFSRIKDALPKEMTAGLDKMVGLEKNADIVASWRLSGLAVGSLDSKHLTTLHGSDAIQQIITALWLLGRTNSQVKPGSEQHDVLLHTLAHTYQHRGEPADIKLAKLLQTFAPQKTTELKEAVAATKEVRELVSASSETVSTLIAYALGADVTLDERDSLIKDICTWFPEEQT